MGISDAIAELIENMISESDGTLELKRNDLANKIGCVPSQINYVITSRFTPEQGYIIESRRGGGGYIRIIKKQMHKNEYLMHFFYALGENLDDNTALMFLSNLLDRNIITPREAKIIRIAIINTENEKLKADIFRQIILTLMD